jgi:hypothetical protein
VQIGVAKRRISGEIGHFADANGWFFCQNAQDFQSKAQGVKMGI